MKSSYYTPREYFALSGLDLNNPKRGCKLVDVFRQTSIEHYREDCLLPVATF